MTTPHMLIEFINENLRRAGWDPVNSDEIVSDTPESVSHDNSKTGGSQSDSTEPPVLSVALKPGEKIAAVILASSGFKDPINGQEHAITSARDIQERQGGDLPVCFITDGTALFFRESPVYPPVPVSGLPTRDDLFWMIRKAGDRNIPKDRDSMVQFPSRGTQNEAIQRVIERINTDKRHSLIVMEGAIGKMHAGLMFCSTLVNTGRARRLLYIVDCPLLREHILRTWSRYLPDETYWPDKPDEAFVPDRTLYVMSSRGIRMLVQAMQQSGQYISPFFFDGVVVDLISPEDTSAYTAVLDYFKADTLGITSRRAEEISPETCKRFGCYAGEPTYVHTREEARSQKKPSLCDTELFRSRPKFRIEGISGPSLPPPVRRYLEQSGQRVSSVDFRDTELERKVINAPTNGVIVREFMEESIKDPGGLLPGKTVIFAMSKGHARHLQDLFDRFYPDYAGRLARVLDEDHHSVRGPGGVLDRFICEAFPRVAIVADGYDRELQIPEVVNIVIAKPVFDKGAFERIVETGTARLPEVPEHGGKAWCQQKDRCLIFDCWGGFEFFRQNPAIRDAGMLHPAVRQFRAWLHLFSASRLSAHDEHRETVIGRIRSEIGSLVEDDAALRDDPAIATVSDDLFWEDPDDQSIAFIEDKIASFFERRAVEDPHEVRFRSDIIDLKAAIRAKNQDLVDTLKEIIIAQVLDLPSSQSEVLRERDLVDAVQYSTWWVSPDEQSLDKLAERLAPLMKYRHHRTEPFQEFTVSDLTTLERRYEYGDGQERLSGREYRERIQTHFERLVPTNPLFQKVLLGEKVAHSEIVKAAEMLSAAEPYITDDVVEELFDLRNPRLMHLVRYVLDFEPLDSWSDSVYHAVAEFIATRTEMSVKQVQFIHTLRSFIIQKKALRRADLKELPFTRIHPEGINGVFSPDEAQELVAFAEALVIS